MQAREKKRDGSRFSVPLYRAVTLPTIPFDGCLHRGDEPAGGFERVGNLFPGSWK